MCIARLYVGQDEWYEDNSMDSYQPFRTKETKKGQWSEETMKKTYACFIMDLNVIQRRWLCCGMLLLLMANFNVGFLMHLFLVIPHVIPSHIWKKGGGVERGSKRW